MALSSFLTSSGDEVQIGRAQQEHLAQVAELRDQLTQKLGFKGLMAIISNSNGPQARAELTIALQGILNSEYYESMSLDEKQQLSSELIDELLGLGPLERLLQDPEITEIMVNGCHSLFYEHKGKLYKAQKVFINDAQIRVVIDRILAPLGRRVDEQSPLVNARLENGYRVHTVIPPIALDGPVMTIRKFSDRISHLSELVNLGSLPAWFAELLSWAVITRKNIAVVGGTGSGKTTLLNALSCEIPHDERIITIEDSAELKFQEHPHVVRLEKREASIEGVGEVSIRELVINSLRMRPDRIVVGECRGAEAIDMLQAMNTGHDGSLTTLHAGSAEEAIRRLVLLSRYGIDLPADVIEEQIASALDFIVVQTRMADGSRKVTDLIAVCPGKQEKVALSTCVQYDKAEKAWKLIKEPSFVQRALEEGRLDRGRVEKWRASSFVAA